MSSTSSRNLTTLYSGAGSVVPQGVYGNANVVSLLAVGTDGGNTVGNITATGNISTTGNVTAAYFIGNIIGSVDAAGANTQVQYNTGNLLDASANLTFNSATDTLSVPNISAISTANLTLTQLGNSDGVTSLNLNANVVVIGNVMSGNPDVVIIGALNKNLRLSTNQSTGPQPRITLRTTGNIDSQPQPVDTDASVNLFGNVVVGNYFGSSPQPTARGNLMVANAVYVGSTISAVGNITANASSFFIGNGSLLTGVTSSYGNANVSNFLANGFGSNSIVTTGNITAGTVSTPTVFSQGMQMQGYDYVQMQFSNAVALPVTPYDIGTGSWFYLDPGGGVFQSNTTGTLQTVVLGNDGSVSATGNITGLVFFGNAAGLTNIPAGNIVGGYGNANVAANLAAFANNPISTSGNITAVNFFGNVTGNITGNTTNALHANVADLANAVAGANVSGTVANATYATSAGHAVTSNTVTNAAQANITSVGTLTALTVTGNVTAANFFGNVTGNITGNVTNALHANVADLANAVAGANVTGTVANATYATSAGSATTATTANTVTDAAQANITSVGTLTSLSVSGNITSGNVTTAGQVTATGNITGGNLITVGTISATAATANVLLSNIVITSQATNFGQQLYPVSPRTIGNLAATIDTGRMMFGNGYAGNVTAGVDTSNNAAKSRFVFWDTAYPPSGYGARVVGLTAQNQVQMTGNLTSAARILGSVNIVTISSEGAGNTFTSPGTPPAAVSGFNGIAQVGNWKQTTAGGMANVGNVIVNTASGAVIGTLAFTGSTIGNSFGVTATAQSFDGTINNQIYFSAWDSFSGTPSTPGNVFIYHNPGTTNTYGVTRSDLYRKSANYYFLRNDDDVAQTKLGSLRSYNEFQYSTATTGTVNIDKTNAQVQFLNPTAIVTIGDFQNFVTTASNSVSNINQTDTVTLIIQQGATPYTVTMPTGNAAIKYLGGISTVGATANAVSIVTIKAIRSAANAAMYLTSISSEYT